MRRSELKRSAGLSSRGKGGACPPKPRQRRIVIPGAPDPERLGWFQSVIELQGDRCVVTGWMATHAHHAVHVSVLKRELPRSLDRDTFGGILRDPRNGVPLRWEPHFEHHHGTKRLPRDVLPESVFVFACELDDRFGTRLEAWLDRTYGGRAVGWLLDREYDEGNREK